MRWTSRSVTRCVSHKWLLLHLHPPLSIQETLVAYPTGNLEKREVWGMQFSLPLITKAPCSLKSLSQQGWIRSWAQPLPASGHHKQNFQACGTGPCQDWRKDSEEQLSRSFQSNTNMPRTVMEREAWPDTASAFFFSPTWTSQVTMNCHVSKPTGRYSCLRLGWELGPFIIQHSLL